jgi:hypothetical protein
VPAVKPVLEAVVLPFDQLKEYGVVPPAPTAVDDPLELPLQLTLILVVVALRAEGCVTVTDLVTKQAVASVTVTVYVPADKPVFDVVVRPFDQLKVYGLLPPLALIVADPFEPPLQLTFVFVAVAVIALGCVTVTERVAEHKAASVTVTVYVPAVRPVLV